MSEVPSKLTREVFEYDKVIEIADRLEVLGIPLPTIKRIRAWAGKKLRAEKAKGKEVKL